MLVQKGIVLALQIIPLTGDGGSKPQDVWDTRIDELAVVDINFLHGTPRPTLAVLYEDPENERRLKTYEVPVNTTGDKDKVDLLLPQHIDCQFSSDTSPGPTLL